MTTPSGPEPFDRLVLLSHQPDKAKAAVQLARAFVRALAKLKVREGYLIAQLDELIDESSLPLGDIPFLPSCPVALCLTGTPRLVAAIGFHAAPRSKARFVKVRPAHPVTCLRAGAFVKGSEVALDVNREFGRGAAEALKQAGWAVESVGEETLAPAFVEASEVLAKAVGTPTSWSPPPSPTTSREPRKARPTLLRAYAKYARRPR
jgi:hypothetical protein